LRAVGIIGYQDSGKTTLVEALARELRDRGHKVAAVKHSWHGIDLQGKDTARLRGSVAQVAFISSAESVIIWEGARTLEQMLSYLDADIVLIEGFKGEGTFPKIVCLRGEPEDRELFDGLAIAAVGPDDGIQGIDVPLMDRDDVGSIADLVEERAFKLPNLDCEACGYDSCYAMALDIVAGNQHIEDCVSLHPTTQVHVNGTLLPMKPFVSDLVRSTVVGLLSTLKGFTPGEIDIRIG
jgi:molybdopterin-guanine dinucleotide biosynthesis protein B